MTSELGNNAANNTITSLTKSHTEFVVYNNRFEEANPLVRTRSVTNTNRPSSALRHQSIENDGQPVSQRDQNSYDNSS